MRLIKPLDINIIASNVPEPDTGEPTVYNPSGTYNTGTETIYNHRRWKCLDDGVSGIAPGTDPLKWSDQGATNRWKMFDEKIGTQTIRGGDLVVTLDASRCGSLALFGLRGTEVRVQLTAGATVYPVQVHSLLARNSASWSDYFWGEMRYRSTLLVSFPIHYSSTVQITIKAISGEARCGQCVVGRSLVIGKSLWSASPRFIDYSRKNADEDGNYTLVPGGYADELSIPVMVATQSMDSVRRSVIETRGSAAVWVGDDTGHMESMVIYGFVREFEPVIQGAIKSEFSLTIEGLT